MKIIKQNSRYKSSSSYSRNLLVSILFLEIPHNENNVRSQRTIGTYRPKIRPRIDSRLIRSPESWNIEI